MKKRIITLTLSILAVVLLVGVGFASWVISQSDSKDITGQVWVDAVVDKRLSVRITEKDLAEKILFSAPESQNTANAWLTNDSGTVAHLEKVFVVEVNRSEPFSLYESGENAGQPQELAITATLDAYFVSWDDDNDAWVQDGTIADGYLIGSAARTVSAWVMSNNDMTATCEVTITMTWGSLFGNENPYTFFNALGIDDPISSAEVTAAGAANLQFAGAALSASNNYGDLAFAALSKLNELDQKLYHLTIAVE